MGHSDALEDGDKDYGGLAGDKIEALKNALVASGVEISRGLTGPMDRAQFKAKLFAPLQKRLAEEEGLPLGKANTVARKLIDEYFKEIDQAEH